ASDPHTLPNPHADSDVDLGKVRGHGPLASAVLDDDEEPPPAFLPAGQDHLAGLSRVDGRAHRRRQGDAGGPGRPALRGAIGQHVLGPTTASTLMGALDWRRRIALSVAGPSMPSIGPL